MAGRDVADLAPRVKRTIGHDAAVWLCGDDAPEERNRVELDHDRLDAWGLPGVRTHYRLSGSRRRDLREILPIPAQPRPTAARP